jgi:hypothetical protein
MRFEHFEGYLAIAFPEQGRIYLGIPLLLMPTFPPLLTASLQAVSLSVFIRASRAVPIAPIGQSLSHEPMLGCLHLEIPEADPINSVLSILSGSWYTAATELPDARTTCAQFLRSRS